jgi:hypothetical protein
MSISTLERWYASQCNGDWEYGYGVHIETLDKPGWMVQIDLHNTKKQSSSLERVAIDRPKTTGSNTGSKTRNFKLHACR